jgi:YggT family protein
MVVDFLYRITEPALKPIRKHIPKLGGFDLSPVVLLIALWFLRNLMFEIFV